MAAKIHPTAIIEPGAQLGADVEAQGEHLFTALHLAARNNDARLMLALLAAGADTEVRSAAGWTAAHVAAGFSHPVAIAILAKHGTNINAVDYEGDTPLTTAAALNYCDTVQQLLASGANPKFCTLEVGARFHAEV